MEQTAADELDLARLAESSVVARVEHFATLGSTQDRAHELARSGEALSLPLLIVAEEQTAGRGRGINRWWTGRGSLAMSLLFDPADWNVSRIPLPERSLAVGVAIVDTIAPLVADHRVGLHWPNDVYAAGKKVAGVLIDVLPDGRHIVGIGLNVNNSLAAAPDEVRARAASLSELAGRPFDRTAVLLNLLDQLQAAVQDSAASPEHFGERFNDLCLQIGQQLTVESGSQRTTGTCVGIAADGALLLDTPVGMQKVYSGVLR